MVVTFFRFITASLVLVIIIVGCAFVIWNFQAKPTLVLHETDATKTFALPAGSKVEINLTDHFPIPGSSLVWSVISSDSTTLSPLSESSPAPLPGAVTAPYRATFLARSRGLGILAAHGATTCESMPKAFCPDQSFTITILVLAGSS